MVLVFFKVSFFWLFFIDKGFIIVVFGVFGIGSEVGYDLDFR